MQRLAWLVLGLSYVGLGLGSLPRLRMNRATIALVGSALLIGLGPCRYGRLGKPLTRPRLCFS